MERSLSSLSFKGSIVDAISEAKRQKKLFVVYVSGDNAESKHLENSTWIDSSVAESLSKYCILLHILEGSTDAANFSAIYPQKPAPCVTAIGYNGIQVWQNDGFVTADVLASTLEKAWLSLHIQETTASFLTAAIASKEQPASSTSNAAASPTEASSSRTSEVLTPPNSDTGDIQYSEGRQISNCEKLKETSNDKCDIKEQERNPKLKQEPSRSTSTKLENAAELGHSAPTKTETVETSLTTGELDSNNKENGCSILLENSETGDRQLKAIGNTSRDLNCDGSQSEEVNKNKYVADEEADASGFPCSLSNDVHLSIRLPDGSSLQVKFSVTDPLKKVKEYVDENRESSFGSYNLAIPYPRKVFDDQDLAKTLSELGLFNRQALVVVLNSRNASHQRNQITSNDNSASSNESSGGYFGFVRKLLSYVNPFSYIGGGASTTNTVQESQGGIWQYGPNASLQDNLRDASRSRNTYLSNQNAPVPGRNSKTRPQSAAHFGSNIHTLKHDEDDDGRFPDRNAFWNGNSTQYGGNDQGK